ncbi:MAG: molybdopterin-dependent oxidoreductase [Candidatus Dormibacteraeota bacterium]|uniref:Molybdopterin-dependent oxidoreductase n=1 Tax=Candidatus Dormiibacter inghamiae TaxID=3127013 RepID=A0A934KKD2_9BACT|nr:molybdopterin-dependent oxidoreductase [Candidatus Dormibacteraeota bacterium]MBJ7607333.1 molybdopterin-dependent oxidoreductase [Candidatus Dormibacteraeota bacterium]
MTASGLRELPLVAATGHRTLRTMCPMNCHPTYCGMVVEIENDRVLSIKGDLENPDSRGFLCLRGRSAVEIVDNPKRLLRPLMRDRREPGAWYEASWEAALDRIADGVRRATPAKTSVWSGHGVYANGYGGPLCTRFAHMLGAQAWVPAIVCWGLGGFGFSLTGVTEVNSMEDLARNSDLVLLWGANFASQANTAPRVLAARKRGATVIAIDVRRTDTFKHANRGFVLRPGTDAALALALMHVIIGEGRHDAAFLADHTVGFEELAAHVRPLTPEWAAAETGLAATDIVELARLYAASKRSVIVAGGSSMHKSGNSWHAARAIACLPALTGSLGKPGAGMGPRHSALSHGMGRSSIVPADRKSPEDSMVSEMSTILDQLEAGRIEALLMFGSNLASDFTDGNRVAAAMRRMPLVVGFDLFLNDTLRQFADVVLPGTSWLEDTGFKLTNTHGYLMDQGLNRRGEARPLSWVLGELADRLGMEGFFPWRSPAELVDALFDHDATRHAKVDEMRTAEPYIELAVGHVGHADLSFPTPSGKVEFVTRRAEELGVPALPVYEPAPENHLRAPQARRYPLVLTHGRTFTHFHGFYDHGRALPSLAQADPCPRLWLNPADAEQRGVADRGPIRLYNDRGEMKARAEVTDRVPPGVTWMHDGWAELNRLTSGARLVSDAAARAFPAGAASYEARIQVEAG